MAELVAANSAVGHGPCVRILLQQQNARWGALRGH
jgi:hypothetical protein